MIVTVTLACLSPANGQKKIQEIEEFDIRSYGPQKIGLTDLVFDARVENITEILNKTQTLGKLVDVYYKIYWIAPSQYKVEVMGLPKGFEEVRNDLALLIKGKLEFVIPESFSEKLKDYALKVEAVKDGKLVKAVDTTYTLPTAEIDLFFDSRGLLKTVEAKTPGGLIKTEFFQSTKSWSNNKLVLDKTEMTTKNGPNVLTTTHSIEYGLFANIGLPTQVTVKNISETKVLVPEKENKKENKTSQGKDKVKFKEKVIKNESGTKIYFTNYEVNTGKAQRFITEGVRR